jgi:hypothetical protein
MPTVLRSSCGGYVSATNVPNVPTTPALEDDAAMAGYLDSCMALS